MERRQFLTAAGAAAAGCSSSRRSRPNVLVILTDDQRWDCLSAAGNPFLKTPHMDRIATEGIHFRNAFVTTSLCSPSRASLLSGLYAHTHGVTNNFTEYPNGLDSYPRILHEAGYRTAYIGKWHMGEENDSPRPGFDHWVSHRGQGKYFDTEYNIDGKRQVVNGYYTHTVTDMAIDWLKKPRQAPFCMILGHKAPHSQNTPEPRYEHVFDNVDIRLPSTAGNTGDGKGSWVRDRIKTWHGIEARGRYTATRTMPPSSEPTWRRFFRWMIPWAASMTRCARQASSTTRCWCSSATMAACLASMARWTSASCGRKASVFLFLCAIPRPSGSPRRARRWS
jgi:N-acetylglucosamine-6-sulfatase